MIFNCEKKLISEYVEGYDNQEPYALFIKNDQEIESKFTYKVKIIAFIPAELKDNFNVEIPTELECIKTFIGDVYMRTIFITWEEDLIESSKSQNSIWSITMEYTPETTDNSEDIGICVKYGNSLDIVSLKKPRLPRGTVVTSVPPITN